MKGARGPRLLPVDPSTGPRLPGIQGLRALAALAILALHVSVHALPEGSDYGLPLFDRYVVPQLALGVTLLLLLSGFLLYRPFAASLIRGTPRPSLRRYLVNRGLRILPAYWAILLVTLVVFQTSLIRDETGGLEPARMTDPVLVGLNLLLLQGFVPQGVLTGIGPAWALGAVVTFYAVLPLLVLGAWLLASTATSRGARTLAALAPALVLVLVGLTGKATAAFVLPPGPWGGWGADWHTVIERSFFAHADMFGFGMAIAVLHVLREDGRLHLPRHWRPAALLVMLAVALPATKFLQTEVDGQGGPLGNYAYDFVLAAVGAVFLAWVVLPDPSSGRPWVGVRILERRWIVAIGVVSYSLFLWHEPLILLLREHGLTFAGPTGLAVNLAAVAALAFALSAVTYHYLERPALIRKSRTAAPRRAPVTPVDETSRSVAEASG